MQYVDLHLWLVHDILMKGDKMGMANSLEVRVPFLDKKVLELAESLPIDYKVRAPKTKVALRAAAERSIRSKTGGEEEAGIPDPDPCVAARGEVLQQGESHVLLPCGEEVFQHGYAH